MVFFYVGLVKNATFFVYIFIYVLNVHAFIVEIYTEIAFVNAPKLASLWNNQLYIPFFDFFE